ncbi:MAG: hypothetical protein ACRCR9_02225, partial [Chitinophagaceae bacterium]
FKSYISVLINTENFSDDLVTNLPITYLYDVSNGCYLEGNVNIKINFSNNTFDQTTINLHFIAGAEQLINNKNNQILFANNTFSILSQVKDRTNNKNYLKYWDGYPFDFSFHTVSKTGDFSIQTLTAGVTTIFPRPLSNVTSLVISDGDITTTLQSTLPLTTGKNELAFKINNIDQNVFLTIDRIDATCGIYLKFLNQYGRWNYWLFDSKVIITRNTRYTQEMENDFYNLEDTISQVLQKGKESNDTLKIFYEQANAEEALILENLFDSPKIFLFTGVRYSKASINDWVEVTLKNTSFETKNKREVYSYFLELQLPERYTQNI